MEINMETLSAVALGIGLSANIGFRVFILCWWRDWVPILVF